MRILFTVAIFLSSALLFLVQPMVARIILPAYGGTASVWTTSELFFQAVLLLGYGYAHFSTRRLGTRRQPWVHLGLMAATLATLPFATRVAGGATGEGAPVFHLLGQLLLMVGATFFVVSAGAPLLQRWFADTDDPHAKDPYFLYSASNLGSMVALLAYPALVEPRLHLSGQTRLWAIGFVALILTMTLCAVALTRSLRKQGVGSLSGTSTPGPSSSERHEHPSARGGGTEITRRMRFRWVALAAVPSSLLLGVTAYISTNIAPIPLLWVVPLALYLLTFILAFKKRPLLTSRPLGRIVGMLIPAIMVAVIMEAFMPVLSFFHLAVFFMVAWMCHARLSESRPSAQHLTEFYFWMSVGGVLGGAFNALVAPVIFNTLFEYPLALILAAFLTPPYRPGSPRNQLDWLYPLALTLVAGVIVITAKLKMEPSQLRTGLAVGVPAVMCYLAVDRPLRFTLSLAGVVLMANGLGIAATGNIVLSERSFFGVHRVTFYGPPGDPSRFHMLTHGNTKHGLQDMRHPEKPLMYYYPNGPIGGIFHAYAGKPQLDNVALVGLGVGSLAAYGQAGDRMTFYEIDPTVRDLATNPRLFTFVTDSRKRGAQVNIVLGDGRLQLAKAPPASYGLVVLDAFSSDAIPIHMLTREAAAMYMSKLAPGGILAYHISNRYLELSGVVAAIAHDLGLVSYIDEDSPSFDETDKGKMASIWMVIARRKEDLAPILKKHNDWSERPPDPSDIAWTDDYSNVLGVLKNDE